jgi:hypothetical protein
MNTITTLDKQTKFVRILRDNVDYLKGTRNDPIKDRLYFASLLAQAAKELSVVISCPGH